MPEFYTESDYDKDDDNMPKFYTLNNMNHIFDTKDETSKLEGSICICNDKTMFF